MTPLSTTEFFHNKTVTLLGLGLLGRGAGDAAFLARHCKKVFVTDMKSADELRVSVDALKEFNNIEFFLGGHDSKIFANVDFVIKGAGVRLDNPYVEQARKNGIPVYMSTALFAHLAPTKMIGVTGTRGKTSTTYMIAEILKQAGKKVLLGGNIRGVSTLALLDSVDQFDIAVLELDSWQLQGFDDLGISPNIAVFTNFYPDHMNYYDGDMQRYLRDKTAIFRHQKVGDVLVTTGDVIEMISSPPPPEQQPPHLAAGWVSTPSLEGRGSHNVIIAPTLPASFKLKIPGTHNLVNASLAREVGKICGIDETIIDDALQKFSGVEGRLQFVGQAQQRNFYNDSNATTQEATLAALTAFPAASIFLIFGGSDKGLPIDQMTDYIAANKIRGALIKGTGSDRVLEKLPNIPVVDKMQNAVKMAIENSQAGDNIILSPAFASFGVFKNEYDRSDQFMTEVKNLIDGKTPCCR